MKIIYFKKSLLFGSGLFFYSFDIVLMQLSYSKTAENRGFQSLFMCYDLIMEVMENDKR